MQPLGRGNRYRSSRGWFALSRSAVAELPTCTFVAWASRPQLVIHTNLYTTVFVASVHSARLRSSGVVPGWASRHGGFTLLEMLVVLMIVSLASGLLFEAASQSMAMQVRVNAQLAQQRGQGLRSDWLRQLVQGLQPDYYDGRHSFKGSATGFNGLTTNGLSSSYGGLTPFAVTLENDSRSGSTALRYGEGEGGLGSAKTSPSSAADLSSQGLSGSVLMQWPGKPPHLRYWDEKNEAHDDWPPPLGRWRPVPSAISLEGGAGDAPWVIMASFTGPLWPQLRPTDVLGNLR